MLLSHPWSLFPVTNPHRNGFPRQVSTQTSPIVFEPGTLRTRVQILRHPRSKLTSLQPHLPHSVFDSCRCRVPQTEKRVTSQLGLVVRPHTRTNGGQFCCLFRNGTRFRQTIREGKQTADAGSYAQSCLRVRTLRRASSHSDSWARVME